MLKREVITWQRKMVTRREVRAGTRMGGRRNDLRISVYKDRYRHTATIQGCYQGCDKKRKGHLAKENSDEERGASRIGGWGEEK